MNFLINLLLGILAGFLADFLLGRMGVSDPIKVVIAFIVGLLVFLSNFAVQLN